MRLLIVFVLWTVFSQDDARILFGERPRTRFRASLKSQPLRAGNLTSSLNSKSNSVRSSNAELESSSEEPVETTDLSNKQYGYGDSDGGYEGTGNEGKGEKSDCTCVPYYQCDNGQIDTAGTASIDPRSIKPPEKQIPLNGKFKPPFCGTYHVCCKEPETSTTIPYVHKCGVRNYNGINSRVLSAKADGEADFGEWPWQAAILLKEGEDNLFQCGGTLIDEYHVLTVAHCVDKLVNVKKEIRVRLGEWDTQSTEEFLPFADYKVEEILIHPEYKKSSLWNDIALLKFSRPVDFKPNIDSVCLPASGEKHDNEDCVTTGWGKTAYASNEYSNVLKEISLKLVPHDACQQKLRKTRLGRWFKLHDSFICAGGEEGKDTCKGDGGGPLVCYRKDGTYSLMGIVSWGIDCGKPDRPGVYVSVRKFLPWIVEKTGRDLSIYMGPGEKNKESEY